MLPPSSGRPDAGRLLPSVMRIGMPDCHKTAAIRAPCALPGRADRRFVSIRDGRGEQRLAGPGAVMLVWKWAVSSAGTRLGGPCGADGRVLRGVTCRRPGRHLSAPCALKALHLCTSGRRGAARGRGRCRDRIRPSRISRRRGRGSSGEIRRPCSGPHRVHDATGRSAGRKSRPCRAGRSTGRGARRARCRSASSRSR